MKQTLVGDCAVVLEPSAPLSAQNGDGLLAPVAATTGNVNQELA